jgi:hypothetical protein
MSARVNALLFLLGLILSLTSLSLLGASLVPPDLVQNFIRFHPWNGIESNFYPTAPDIRAILDSALAGEPAGTEPVIVLVGGTSVFEGTSQAPPQVWTQQLQQILGDRFRVLNLAQRAGRPNDFGNLAAEMLLKDHRRFIYLCDAMPAEFTIPIEKSYYLKTVFDAWLRGYLLDWPARDAKMRSAFWDGSAQFRETAWGALADRYLNFNSLWTYVSFEIAGTIWNKVEATESMRPLREFPDAEPPPEWWDQRGYPTGDIDTLSMSQVRKQIFPPQQKYWDKVRAGIEEQMPVQLREKSLVVVNLNSPYYLDRLSPEEQAGFMRQADQMAHLLTDAGLYRALVVAGDFTDRDYTDRVHLSVRGGAKLADRIAPEIVEMAEHLGYLQ